MTTFFLVRHAEHSLLHQVLVGRMAGVRLSSTGYARARALAECLKGQGLTAVQSSPRERACETAALIAREAAIPFELAPALDEIDYGEWTGRSFASLADDSGWIGWNAERGRIRPPGGES